MAVSMTYLSSATKAKKTPDEIRPAPNIAAIDFGTSSVSLAYSINGNNEVKMLKLHHTYERVPNAILIRKEEGGKFTVQQFGQNAQEKYRSLQQSDKENYIYFERIKILLKRSENISRTTTVESLTDGEYYLVEVIAFIITYLKERLLRDLPRSNEVNEYKSTDFDWVITVPAIWGARAKRMMREAAYMAGLTSEDQSITTKFTPVGSEIPRPPEINPDKLFLALEPEAAAIFAQDEAKKPSKVPQRYMVVDIGGGTVDITVHDQGDGKVHILLPPTGNMWGGITVNEACEHLLERIFGDEGFQRYFKKYPNGTDISDIVFFNFENQKKLFGSSTHSGFTDTITIELPRRVIELYSEKVIKNRVKLIKADYEDERIYIKYDVVRQKMFQPTVDHILLCIDEGLKKELSTKVDTVYVVGGFGGCEFMYSEVQKALQSFKCFTNIVRPYFPELAVVKGAVMWRQNPSIIQSRKVDATYGTSCCQEFNPLKHDMQYHFCSEDNILYCDNIFTVFIEKGDATEINDVYTTTYTPRYSAQTVMNIPIYSIFSPGFPYTRDASGQLLYDIVGELIIDIPNPDNKPKSEREVEVSMSFSGTEIRAKAKYCITGEEVKIVCDFFSHQLSFDRIVHPHQGLPNLAVVKEAVMRRQNLSIIQSQCSDGGEWSVEKVKEHYEKHQEVDKELQHLHMEKQQIRKKLSEQERILQEIENRQVTLQDKKDQLLYQANKRLQQEKNQQLHHFQQTNRQLEQEKNQLQQEKNQLQQEKGQLQQEKDQLQKEKNQLQLEKNQLQQEKGQLQQEKDQLQQEKGQLQKEKNQLQLEKGQLQREKNQFQQEKGQLQQEKNQLQQEKGQLQRENGRLQRENNQLQLEKVQLRQENGQLQQEKGQLRQEKGQLQQENGQLQQENGQLQQESGQLQIEKDQLQQEKDQLQHQLSQHEGSWMIKRDEIHITQEVIGQGGWGEVRVANFRGLRVAAKCLHFLIISHHNISIFNREMDIASKIRHPNLLQFIGATREGSPPIILCELMPTSLRHKIETGPLTRPQIIRISQDVSCALNYLHLYRPHPILHRDVSSSNVLLQPSMDGGWKAKLSDYGSANFIQDISPTSEIMPGCFSYSAPEACYPDDHSPAMDVYSFGVLLMEMVLCQSPSSTTSERERQADIISWPLMKRLVKDCINRQSSNRPCIAVVLDHLKTL